MQYLVTGQVDMQKGSIQKKPCKFDADAAGNWMQNCAKLRKFSTNVRRKSI
jgi:hypothetical protein